MTAILRKVEKTFTFEDQRVELNELAWDVYNLQLGNAKLSDFSVVVNANSGTGNLTYDDTTGEFEYTPPDLSQFLTSYTETDPIFVASVAYNITAQNVTDWNNAHSWGNHALEGYIKGIGSFSIGALSDVDTTTNAPSAKDHLVFDGTNWVPTSPEANVFISDAPPANPDVGDLWYESDKGALKIYYEDADSTQWVDTNVLPVSSGAGITLADLSVITDNPLGGGGLVYDNTTGEFTFTPANVLSLSDFSVTTASPSGGGSLTYLTGTFTYTPPDLSTYLELTDLSVNVASPNGNGTLTYSDITGVFTYTPPDLSSGTSRYSLPVATTTVLGGVKIDGTTITINNGTISAVSSGGGSTNVSIGTTAPTNATAGDLWWNSTQGQLKIYYNDGNSSQWVDACGPNGTSSSGGASVTVSDTAPTNPSGGDLWWNSSQGQLKIYYSDANSSQWVDTAGGGGGTISSLNDIGDVNVGTVITGGHVLKWDDQNNEWIAGPDATSSGGSGISGINIKDDQGVPGGPWLDLGNATGLNFQGNGVQVNGTGDEKTVIIPGGIQVQNNGTQLSTTCFQLNFTGAGVTASGTDATKTINIPGGGSGINNIVEDTTPQLGGDLDVQTREINTSTSNGNIKLTPNGSGVVEVKGAGGNDGTLQLNCSQNSHGVKIKSPPHSAGASYTLTLPNDDGEPNEVLTTDGSGNLSWSSSGGSGTAGASIVWDTQGNIGEFFPATRTVGTTTAAPSVTGYFNYGDWDKVWNAREVRTLYTTSKHVVYFKLDDNSTSNWTIKNVTGDGTQWQATAANEELMVWESTDNVTYTLRKYQDLADGASYTVNAKYLCISIGQNFASGSLILEVTSDGEGSGGSGGGGTPATQDLQSVTDQGKTTTNDITAAGFTSDGDIIIDYDAGNSTSEGDIKFKGGTGATDVKLTISSNFESINSGTSWINRINSAGIGAPLVVTGGKGSYNNSGAALVLGFSGFIEQPYLIGLDDDFGYLTELYGGGNKVFTTQYDGVQPIGALYDKDDEKGTAGQILSSTGTALDWIDPPTGGNGIVTANVKDFGAVGDNSTDDRAAIQNAINSLVNGSVGDGGVVYLPPGVYRISAPLTFGSTAYSITLKGSTTHFPVGTFGGSIIRNTGSGNAIEITNSMSITITNLGIDHTSSSAGTAISATSTASKQGITVDQVYILDHSKGIDFIGYANSIIRNTEIRDQPNDANSTHAILLKKGGDARQDQIRLENVIVEGETPAGSGNPHNHSVGLKVEDWTNSIWVKDCAFLRMTNGIEYDQSMGGEVATAGAFHRIENTDVDHCRNNGMFFDGGYAIWVQNCYIGSNGYPSGSVSASGLVTGENFKGTMWINNADCRGNSLYGLAFNVNHNKIHINSCHCGDNGAASPASSAGIFALNGANDITIIGGQCGGNNYGDAETNSVNQQNGIKFDGDTHRRININGVDTTGNISSGIVWQLGGQNTMSSSNNFIQNCPGYSTGQTTFP